MFKLNSIPFPFSNMGNCLKSEKKQPLSSARIIILGFAAVILAGSFLLMLPFATHDGRGASFLDALFTSVSAVCVTGLVVQDTATYWSVFGQCTIIVLIQIGGMGVVTVASLFSLISGSKIGLRRRSIMQDALSAPTVGGIVRMTRFIIKWTLIIELFGALLLCPSFCRAFGFLKGVLYSLFHSVSAFCNAGFDLMGTEEAQFVSLVGYAADPLVNAAIMLMIIVGGIGFLTWDDIAQHKFNFRKYRMQTKAVLLFTAVLIIIPAVFFFFFEFESFSPAKRTFMSLFQSVTPRTAGFNTADLTAISESGIMLMICLMLVGGSSGSTAGGMKITTLAVLVSCAVSVFRKKGDSAIYGRRIPQDIVRSAAAIFLMYISLFIGGAWIISRQGDLRLSTCMFETASAIATVGLSLGITPALGTISQAILIVLMFIGRVGGLTLIFAAVAGRQNVSAKLPQEKITVG